MPKRKSHAEFLQDVYKQVGYEYTVLGSYVQNKVKIEMRHEKCGHEYLVKPNAFLSLKRRCPNCFKSYKKTTEQFKREVYENVKGEYTVLGDYVNTDSPILIRHNLCGKEYHVVPYNFIKKKGTRCGKCARKEQKTTEIFKEELKSIYGEEYVVVGEYLNNHEPIEILHLECNKIFTTTPSRILYSSKCSHCYGIKKLSNEDFLDLVKELVNDEYKILGEYRTMIDKIKIKHNKCGHVWDVKCADFVHNSSRCPKCKQSKGERAIEAFLNFNNIFFKRQHSFEDCRNIFPLRFDFAVFDKEENLLFLIEYDGELHFKAVDYFGGNEQLDKRRNNDKIKNNYCKNNNLRLIRIPYWDYENIEVILDKELNTNTNTTRECS